MQQMLIIFLNIKIVQSYMYGIELNRLKQLPGLPKSCPWALCYKIVKAILWKKVWHIPFIAHDVKQWVSRPHLYGVVWTNGVLHCLAVPEKVYK